MEVIRHPDDRPCEPAAMIVEGWQPKVAEAWPFHQCGGCASPYGGVPLRHTSRLSPWLCWIVNRPGRPHPNIHPNTARDQAAEGLAHRTCLTLTMVPSGMSPASCRSRAMLMTT